MPEVRRVPVRCEEMRSHRPPARRSAAAGMVAIALALVLGGCFTGERPTLTSPPPGGAAGSSTGDPNLDAVLGRLESVHASTFTADYDILHKLGQNTTKATVVQEDANRSSVTIGDVRFLQATDQPSRTCNLESQTCEDSILDARTSDVGVTSSFFAATPARRLRISASRKAGPTTASTRTVAGQPATCVEVPFAAGSELYCALDSGAVALWDGADLHVELTNYGAQVDESKFATTR
jgi:hypothetical protein